VRVSMVPRNHGSRALLFSILLGVALLALYAPVPAAGSSGTIQPSQSAVVATIPLDVTDAFYPAYDGANGNVYVSGWVNPLANGTEFVISGATNQVLATAPVGWEPGPSSADPYNGDVYVPNFDPTCGNCGSSFVQAPPTVSVISGSTNTALSSVRTLGSPTGVAYDSRNGDLYVSDMDWGDGNGSLSVISGVTNQVLVNITMVGVQPSGAVFDGANGDIYVMDQDPNWGMAEPDHVTVVSGSTNTVVASIPLLGNTSGSVVLDPVNGDLYVGGTRGMLAISSSTNSVVQSFAIPDASPQFVDPLGDVYALGGGSAGNAYVISGASNSIISTFSIGNAEYMTFDPVIGDIYTTAWGSDFLNVTSIASSKLVQSLDLGAGEFLASAPVYDPGNGNLYMVQGGSWTNVVVISPNGPLTGSSAAGSINPWLSAGIGVGIGVLATAGVVVLFRRRERTAGKPT